jgi:hypothetical protein
MVLTVAALMAAMLVASAMPAFADAGGVPNLGNSAAAKDCHDAAKLAGTPPGACVSEAAHA